MLSFITSIFSPAVKLIDKLHVSDAERMELQNALASIQSQMHAKSIELMSVEAKSENWIVATWRPLCAMSLFCLILADGFNLVQAPLQVYHLAEIFLGVYGGGRSLEKIVSAVRKS